MTTKNPMVLKPQTPRTEDIGNGVTVTWTI